jgi:hypothetical protein
VPWWPPATGWYVLTAILLVVVLVLCLRFWRRWRATAHRREALRALESASDAATIASLLRRTALVEYPRSEIAKLTGNAWVDWLAARSPEPVVPSIRAQLVTGAYSSAAANNDLTALRIWVGRWISDHHSVPATF